MALHPIVVGTLQAAVISGLSNIIAQAITAYREEVSLIIDWVPVAQFFVFALIQTPPNFLWQSFLEETFPTYYAHVSPTREAVAAAGAGEDEALDVKARQGRLVEPTVAADSNSNKRLNVANTLAKTALDQTVGAFANTMLFSLCMNAAQMAMAAADSGRPAGESSLAFLLSGNALDYSAVDWPTVLARSRAEFWLLVCAGWSFWPFVSLANFALVPTVEARNLVGNLAGVAWGVYMSLFAAAR